MVQFRRLCVLLRSFLVGGSETDIGAAPVMIAGRPFISSMNGARHTKGLLLAKVQSEPCIPEVHANRRQRGLLLCSGRNSAVVGSLSVVDAVAILDTAGSLDLAIRSTLSLI